MLPYRVLHSKKDLVENLTDKLEDKCSDQICWSKQKFMKNIDNSKLEEIFHNTFRPPGPQGKFTWLDTFNINDVMEQYEKKYKDFKTKFLVSYESAEKFYEAFGYKPVEKTTALYITEML